MWWKELVSCGGEEEEKAFRDIYLARRVIV